MTAKTIAEQGYLVTLGIKPTYASTGYGYIRQGDSLGMVNNVPYYAVRQFTEKPDKVVAERFLKQGTYLWNSGMFIWQVRTILDEIQKSMPGLYQVIEQLNIALDTHQYPAALQTLWPC